jgi:hypothetical protein
MEQKPTCPAVKTPALSDPPNPSTVQNYLALLPSNLEQRQPSTWEGHALWMSLFAAKFGNGTLPATDLYAFMKHDNPLPTVAPAFINYLEDNNETNKNWLDEAQLGIMHNSTAFLEGKTLFYFSPLQYAAMFRADVNGNGGLMTYLNGTKTLGIRNNSKLKHIAMAGTTGLNGQYLNDMAMGNKNFIANFHHYCTDASAAQNTEAAFMDPLNGEFSAYNNILIGTAGVAPEKDNLRHKLQWLKSGIGDGYQEYWLSEFGYDSYPSANNNSFVDAQPIDGPDGHYDAQKVQAQWLVRGVLETAWSQSIDKLMLYEIRDDKSQGENSYRYSGLLDDNGNYKRAWFYIMTLKKVLGEYEFEREIVDNFDNFTVSTGGADVRIYQFVNKQSGSADGLSNRIFVAWSPTWAAVQPYTCTITFPSTGIYQNLPQQGTLTRIQELNENGIAGNLSPAINGQTVAVAGVSETPLFFRFGGTLSRPAPTHVSNLSCQPGCCGSVKLTWTDSTQSTMNTRVYYLETPANGICPGFDPTIYHLYANNTGINLHSITVSGLNNGKSYCFCVIPVNLQGLVPEDLNMAPIASCTTNPGGCNSCLVHISPAEVSLSAVFPNMNPGGQAVLQGQINDVLGLGTVQPTCTALTDNCNTSQNVWTYWMDPNPGFPDPNTVYINFATPKVLNTIFIQDWNGNGQLLIEYKRCGCTDWLKLATVDLLGDFYCDGSKPAPVRMLTNLNSRIISALRITKLQSRLTVGHIFFCGADAACPTSAPPSVSPGDPAFTADEIRNNSAVLHWNSLILNKLDDVSELSPVYYLKVSQQLDDQGNLYRPIPITVEADGLRFDNFYRLEGLAPATTYYVELVIPPICSIAYSAQLHPVARIMFTTLLKGLIERSDAQPPTAPDSTKSKSFDVYMRPNPAREVAHLSVSKGKFQLLEILEENGRLVKQFNGNRTVEQDLDLQEIKQGTYWLHVTNTENMQLTVLFIKE